jgi:hypothetical protein
MLKSLQAAFSRAIVDQPRSRAVHGAAALPPDNRRP